VPALKHLEGPYLALVREALHALAAEKHGISREEYVERLDAGFAPTRFALKCKPVHRRRER
jgi:hypothetical protein